MKESHLVSLVLLLALSTSSKADEVYAQPLNTWASGWCSPCYASGPFDTDFRVFASFKLNTQTVLTLGRFAIADISPGVDDLNISIWNQPFNTQFYSLTVAGSDYRRSPMGNDPLLYWAEIKLPSWSLPANNYWISLYGVNGNRVGWGSDYRSGDDRQFLLPYNAILNSTRYVGFSLAYSPVPIPGAAWLFGSVVLGFCLNQRRKPA